MGTKRIVIPGGSGFIGDYLALYFVEKGYEVVVLSRSKEGLYNGVYYALWDAQTLGCWTQYVDGSYALINLAGRSIDCRFTPENRGDILSSRIESVNVLQQVCLKCSNPPQIFIQVSSVGYYGNSMVLCTEETPAGSGFLSHVCTLWERTFNAIDLPLTRKVVFRLGVVLGENGGALHRMLPWTKFYLGGQLGNGRQFMSWISIFDLARMFEFALENSTIEGVFNATSSNPVSNAVFMASLRKVMNRPWAPPVPAIFVKLGASLFMGTNSELILQGAACVPHRLLESGFNFKFPELLQALNYILNRSGFIK
jgi:uncharacterized protein